MEELFETTNILDIPDNLSIVQFGDSSEIVNNSTSRYFENCRNPAASGGFHSEMWSTSSQSYYGFSDTATTVWLPKPIPTLENPCTTDSSVCQVCWGYATGKYYGVHACDSCRAFFRRTVLFKDRVTCDRDGRCDISLNSNVRCRSCRYQKCLAVGMQAPLKLRGTTTSETEDFPESKKSRVTGPSVDDGLILRTTQTLCMSSLLEAFYASQHVAQKSVHDLEPQSDPRKPAYRVAYHNIIHAQLLWMVEWAKGIQGFRDLVLEDQITLLRSASRKHIVIQIIWETARCSKDFDNPNVSWGWGKLKANLKEAAKVVKGGKMEEYYRAYFVTLCSLVKSFAEAGISEEELACFEALFLLDPNTEGLHDRKKVMNIRKNLQSMIMSEEGRHQNLPLRVMDFYQLLPGIDYLSRLNATNFKVSRYSGAGGKQCSKLIEDLYLSSISNLDP